MIGRLSFHKRFVPLFMDLTSGIQKYFRDLRNKKKEFFLKCNPMIRNLHVILLSRLFAHALPKKKKGDISTSAIDKSLQITE